MWRSSQPLIMNTWQLKEYFIQKLWDCTYIDKHCTYIEKSGDIHKPADDVQIYRILENLYWGNCCATWRILRNPNKVHSNNEPVKCTLEECDFTKCILFWKLVVYIMWVFILNIEGLGGSYLQMCSSKRRLLMHQLHFEGHKAPTGNRK